MNQGTSGATFAENVGKSTETFEPKYEQLSATRKRKLKQGIAERTPIRNEREMHGRGLIERQKTINPGSAKSPAAAPPAIDIIADEEKDSDDGE
jgi:hypothetical protein